MVQLIKKSVKAQGLTAQYQLALDRKVVGVDINPLATFITEMQIQQVDIKALEKYYRRFWMGVDGNWRSCMSMTMKEKGDTGMDGVDL